MSLKPKSFRLRHLPLRVAAGAFLLNSGITKRSLEGEHAAALQAEATRVLPALGKVKPEVFGTGLAHSEITLGALLLAPIVPPTLVGAGLTAFSGGLVTMYARTPELHQPGSLRPTPKGIALAKDTWLLGIGVSLLVDGLGLRRARKHRVSI